MLSSFFVSSSSFKLDFIFLLIKTFLPMHMVVSSVHNKPFWLPMAPVILLAKVILVLVLIVLVIAPRAFKLFANTQKFKSFQDLVRTWTDLRVSKEKKKKFRKEKRIERKEKKKKKRN